MSAVETAGETAVEQTMAEPTMPALSERLEQRLREMSERLRYCEKRLMQENVLAHELVRMMSTAVDEFAPAGDFAWLLRLECFFPMGGQGFRRRAELEGRNTEKDGDGNADNE